MELCLLCDKLSAAPNPIVDERNGDLSNLFAGYFNLTPEELELLKSQLGQDFPFCKKCQPILFNLGQLQSQLTEVQNDIAHIVARIASTIMSLVSLNNTRTKFMTPKLLAIHNFRKTIFKHYTPRVVIKDHFTSLRADDPKFKLALWGSPSPQLNSSNVQPLNEPQKDLLTNPTTVQPQGSKSNQQPHIKINEPRAELVQNSPANVIVPPAIPKPNEQSRRSLAKQKFDVKAYEPIPRRKRVTQKKAASASKNLQKRIPQKTVSQLILYNSVETPKKSYQPTRHIHAPKGPSYYSALDLRPIDSLDDPPNDPLTVVPSNEVQNDSNREQTTSRLSSQNFDGTAKSETDTAEAEDEEEVDEKYDHFYDDSQHDDDHVSIKEEPSSSSEQDLPSPSPSFLPSLAKNTQNNNTNAGTCSSSQNASTCSDNHNSMNSSSTTTQNVSQSADNTMVKRGRGRPKGSLKKIRSGRGRPRKYQTAATKTANNISSSSSSITERKIKLQSIRARQIYAASLKDGKPNTRLHPKATQAKRKPAFYLEPVYDDDDKKDTPRTTFSRAAIDPKLIISGKRRRVKIKYRDADEESKKRKGAKKDGNNGDDDQDLQSSEDEYEPRDDGRKDPDFDVVPLLPIPIQKQLNPEKFPAKPPKLPSTIEESPGVFRLLGTDFTFTTGPHENGYFTCGMCSKKSKNKPYMVRHYRLHHDTTIRRCQKCNRGYVREEDLEKHHCKPLLPINFRRKMFTDLGDGKFLYYNKWPYEKIEPDPETGNEFKCGTCQSLHLTEHRVTIHIRSRHMEHGFVCETCGSSFHAPSRLRMHQQIHIETSNFICEVCAAAFRSQRHLDGHRNRVHLIGVTPEDLQCHYPGCGRQFNSATTLQRHKTRVGHRMFRRPVKVKCERCKKVLLSKKGLMKHQETCKGLQTFPCSLCELVFRSKNGHVNHMERVHGISPDKIYQDLIPADETEIDSQTQGLSKNVSMTDSELDSSAKFNETTVTAVAATVTSAFTTTTNTATTSTTTASTPFTPDNDPVEPLPFPLIGNVNHDVDTDWTSFMNL